MKKTSYPHNHKRKKAYMMSLALASTAVCVAPIQLPHAEAATVPTPLNPSQYKDYDSKAWWANDMVWGVNRGIISGYMNAKHPTQPNKGWGNWLDPAGPLTEYQMLSVMMRYIDAQEIANINVKYQQEKKKNIAYGEYVMAKDYGIVTKGTKDNANYANTQVTRGQMAQAIVSMHYGKAVSLNDAINFMYANGLSKGKASDGAKTIANFGANDRLERNQIIAFMHRYEKLMASQTKVQDTIGLGQPSEKMLQKFPNQKVTTPEVTKPETQKPESGVSKIDTTKTGMQGKKYADVEKQLKDAVKSVTKPAILTDKKYTSKYGIKTVHPNATFNVKNQAEYDAVLAAANKLIANMNMTPVNTYLNNALTTDIEYSVKHFTGEYKYTIDRNDPNTRTKHNTAARAAESAYGDAYNLGVSLENILKFNIAGSYVGTLISSTNTLDGPPETAYDYFIKDEVDCTSLAYAQSFMYMSMGYQTSVIHSPGRDHAFTIIYLDGHWFNTDGGELKPYNQSTALKGDYITEKPAQGFEKISFVKVVN